jgi:hypothetical protein
MAHHLQHRTAGGAAGLAVVVRGRLATGHQGPADMRGSGVFGAQRGDHGQRGRAVGHRLHAADEAALLDEQFAVDRPCQREAHPACLEELNCRRART